MFNNHALYSGWDCTAAFEMHPDALTTERYGADYKEWLQQPHDFPIYTHGIMPGVPASQPYPIDVIRERYGRFIWQGENRVQDFFSTSFPYAFALAITKHYPIIECYGIDMTDKGGYAKHKPDVFYWLGIAPATGIQIYFPEDTQLFTPTLYPFPSR
jgi:hypothetical protein